MIKEIYGGIAFLVVFGSQDFRNIIKESDLNSLSRRVSVKTFYATSTPLLRVSSLNPRYFADSSGQIVYLTGSHTWANMVDAGHSYPPPKFDFNGYLAFL